MLGILFALVAGFFISLQNVTNATIGAEVGTWTTAMITQAVGALGAFLIFIFSRNEQFIGIKKVKPLYLFGGSFGAIVVASSVIAVTYAGASVANSFMLIAQMGIVVIIEAFGKFDLKKQRIESKQWVGLAFMIIGTILISS